MILQRLCGVFSYFPISYGTTVVLVAKIKRYVMNVLSCALPRAERDRFLERVSISKCKVCDVQIVQQLLTAVPCKIFINSCDLLCLNEPEIPSPSNKTRAGLHKAMPASTHERAGVSATFIFVSRASSGDKKQKSSTTLEAARRRRVLQGETATKWYYGTYFNQAVCISCPLPPKPAGFGE